MFVLQISEVPKVYIYDTPGIMLPHIPDMDVGMKLAVCGSQQHCCFFVVLTSVSMQWIWLFGVHKTWLIKVSVITPIVTSLPWLRISECIEYKMLMMTALCRLYHPLTVTCPSSVVDDHRHIPHCISPCLSVMFQPLPVHCPARLQYTPPSPLIIIFFFTLSF